MLMPALVEPTATEEQTISVVAKASGMESIRMESPWVQPFSTKGAEAANEVDANGFGRVVRDFGQRHMGIGLAGFTYREIGVTGNAFMDDGHTELRFQG